jgi:hypothetical protein
MRIISKYKDFYDYLQGIYGIDPKIVYDRRWENESMFTLDDVYCNGDEPQSVLFSICDIYYVVYVYKNVVYVGDEIKSILEEIIDDNNIYYYLNDKYISLSELVYHLKSNNINTTINCPSVIINGTGKYKDVSRNIKSHTFRMSDFGINRIVSPHDMYVMISNFLSKENDVIDNRTNVEKIESNGFDKKVSFRNM